MAFLMYLRQSDNKPPYRPSEKMLMEHLYNKLKKVLKLPFVEILFFRQVEDREQKPRYGETALNARRIKRNPLQIILLPSARLLASLTVDNS
ncbi:hypothetical protein Zmor_004395 [Zophobas morio]|uniref:Uncharacterized protein n=1 Tax=Zophobas morio TaxID=2755281 RepID=A0AA38LZF3_9CUCU|nr:hypothetical protein Zmor_004395 [Zophobas morio]